MSRTFSVDEVSQSMVWLGLAEEVTAENALAVLLSMDGNLVLRATRNNKLIVRNNETVSEHRLSREANTILFIASERADSMTRVHARPVTDGMREYGKVLFSRDTSFTIGRAEDCGVYYPSRFVSSQHAQVVFSQGQFSIKDLESGNGTLVNGEYLPPRHPHDLAAGDVVQILDLTFMVGKGFLSCNHPEGVRFRRVVGAAPISHDALVGRFPKPDESKGELELFYPAPRLSRTVADYELQVDDPPAKKEEDETPFLMQIGPSMFMGLSSIATAAYAFSRLADGASVISVLPQFAMTISMLGGSLIWPVISKNYNRRRDRLQEEKRSRRYVEYLDGVENQLMDEARLQGEILRENRLPTSEIIDRAHQLSPFMMNRMSVHGDFLELRVGMGDIDLAAGVKWQIGRAHV